MTTLTCAAFAFSQAAFANAKIQVNLDVAHHVGDQHSFDRSRFITFHETPSGHDLSDKNEQSRGLKHAVGNLHEDFLVDRDVYFGRDSGDVQWRLHYLLQSFSREGWADPYAINKAGKDQRTWYSTSKDKRDKMIRKYDDRYGRMIYSTQQRPIWPDGATAVAGATGRPWHFSSIDSAEEPFGSAVGEFLGLYFNNYFRAPGSKDDGQIKPMFFEVMNEPVLGLMEFTNGMKPATIKQIAKYHNVVATYVRRFNPEMKVGGYSTAYPDYDTDNFAEWEKIDKYFLDIAGPNMDFISLHLYDLAAVPTSEGPKEQLRRGANMEATLDMLDAYMAINYDEPKPLVISEYGSRANAMLDQPWSSYRDWQMLKSMNAMLMQMLERPNRIEQAVPFVPVKAEWGRDPKTGIPYQWRLLIQQKERPGQSGNDWVYSDLVHFYDLWNGVQGKRLDSWASDPDIQVDAYVDGKKLYIIANSLENKDLHLDLSVFGADKLKIKYVELRQLSLGKNKQVEYVSKDMGNVIPLSLPMAAESTSVLAIEFNKKLNPKEKVEESRLFANSMTQDIAAKDPMTFTIWGVEPAAQGEAILRLGLGRKHGLSLKPKVLVNGSEIKIPDDFRGYDQLHNSEGKPGRARDNFFGVLEIPVPYELLKKITVVELTFPDSGGKVSSVAIQNMKHSKPIKRL
ncbi:agarase [Agaribacterium haliotis]|uniref:agarase n=1 Tax=Agaribacterium haliotis TaxID=2013869 RepID=UPI000BB59022|nr:agarase [Agaribacterium haliotis]